MTKKTYAEKLKDPRWQKKRLEVLERAGWACEMCCDTENTFHVHHKVYFKGREPWEYDVDQLSAICEECHRVEHECADRFKEAESRLPLDGPNNREFFALVMSGALGLRVDLGSVWEEEAYRLGKSIEDVMYKAIQTRRERDQEAANGKNTDNKA